MGEDNAKREDQSRRKIPKGGGRGKGERVRVRGEGKEVKKACIRERGDERTRKTREDRDRAVSLKHRSKRGPPHYVGYNRGAP